jgi:ATP-dependent phosphofructokinase / diphosphate-dependent phosphofructokinase
LFSGKHGNLVIGQAGGATAVINASLVGAFEAAQKEKRIGGIYGMHYGVEGLLKEDLIDLRQQPADVWSRLLHTPSAALGSTHYHLNDEDLERLINILHRKDIRYVLYIGGNGSAETVHRIVRVAHEKHYECYAVSVPKTIDNDLPYTDHCPGYGSAARFLALTIMHSTMNMLSVPERYPLKVIETAGRNVGWLSAASALAKREEDDAPHLILVPEHPFQGTRFLQQVESIYRRLGYAVIVAAEALRDDQGHQVGPTEHDKTKSTAQYVGNLIKERLQMDVRFDKPGDLQWSDISPVDRDEAYLVGQKGVEVLLAHKSDTMITLVREDVPTYRSSTSLVELEKVVNKQRFLPEEYLDSEKSMVTQPFYNYALPLLGNPLPTYPKLKPIKVL